MKTFLRKSLLHLVLVVTAVPLWVVAGYLTAPKARAAGDIPSLDIYTLDNAVISPNTDGTKDIATIDLLFSEQVSVNMDIDDSLGNKVKDLYTSSGVTNPAPKVWDGKNNGGTIVPDGMYTVKIVFTDTDGDNNSVTDTSKSITVDTVAPTATVSYSTTAQTNQNVTATIYPSENVTVLNPAGQTTYTFLDNGSFTFSFRDDAGNTGSSMATVTNIDRVLPEITMTGSSIVTVDQYANYIDAGATATDDHDGMITSRIVTTPSGDTQTAGQFIVYYDVSDLAGNAAPTVWRTVNVTAANVINLTESDKNVTISVIQNAISGTVINIPAGLGGGTLDLSALKTNPSDVTVTLTHQVTINLATANGTVQVIIPAGTTITGPAGWDGILNLPEVVSNPASSTIAGRQLVITDLGTIAIGLSDNSLTFSNPVELKFAGQAGKHVGFIDLTGEYTEITAVCDAAISPTISGNGECKIDSGSDLVVWTKHFTQFSTYNQTVAVPSNVSATNVQRNGNNYIDVTWENTDADSYANYVNGNSAPSAIVTSNSVEFQVLSAGQYTIGVRAIVGGVYSELSTVVSVNVSPISPSTGSSGASSTTGTTTKKLSSLVSSAQAEAAAPAPTAPSSTSAATGDSNGIVKAAESTPSATATTNWTPWIVLFVLIILAGAATGGYFYWFASKEELATASTAKDMRKIKSAAKSGATVKVREKVKEPPKQTKKPNRW